MLEFVNGTKLDHGKNWWIYLLIVFLILILNNKPLGLIFDKLEGQIYTNPVLNSQTYIEETRISICIILHPLT